MAWKIFTHDLRAPIQGGKPIWVGAVPYDLPTVGLDTSEEECGEGWNCCESLSQAFRIAGLWPDGRPSRAFLVEPSADAVVRGNKIRSSGMRIVREATEEEILESVQELSQAFGPHADHMVASQVEWRRALARPASDVAAVEAGLRQALEARGLSDWNLKRFDSKKGIWGARDSRAAWAAWAAWEAWEARDSRAAWDAWDTWDVRVAWDAWDTRDAWAARDALIVEFAALQGLIDRDPQLLTVGIREAYGNGLGLVYPTGPKELGWCLMST